jgi:hypothetical protein
VHRERVCAIQPPRSGTTHVYTREARTFLVVAVVVVVVVAVVIVGVVVAVVVDLATS